MTLTFKLLYLFIQKHITAVGICVSQTLLDMVRLACNRDMRISESMSLGDEVTEGL